MQGAEGLVQLRVRAGGWDVSGAENLSVPGAREQEHNTSRQTGQPEDLREAKDGQVSDTCPGAMVIHGLAAFRVFCRECCGAATPWGHFGAVGAVVPWLGMHKSRS